MKRNNNIDVSKMPASVQKARAAYLAEVQKEKESRLKKHFELRNKMSDEEIDNEFEAILTNGCNCNGHPLRNETNKVIRRYE